jgi:ABC-type protease/lipase transport system fused ATPase/permease subunit
MFSFCSATTDHGHPMNAQGTTVRSALAEATFSIRNAAAGALALGVFANLAALTLPLYSMQVYDRVLMSRSITTLLMLTVIAVFMLGVQAALDAFRSAILARCGIAIERLLSIDVFDGALRGFCSPDNDRMQKVRIVREFISSGLTAFLDLPWVPLFIILTFAMFSDLREEVRDGLTEIAHRRPAVE